MAKKHFERALAELHDAIREATKPGVLLPALMLMYAGIDIMGSLNKPDNGRDPSKRDFKEWVKTYVVELNPAIGVNEHDLYGARCGLLHAMQLESKDSRSGDAKELWMVEKPASRESLQAAINKASLGAKAVYFDELISAFLAGVARFRTDVESDLAKAPIVYRRAEKIPMFCNANEYTPNS